MALFAGGSLMSNGLGAGVGAAAQIAGQMASGDGDPSKGIGFVRDNWYGEPLALFLAALFLVRKKPAYGYALAGASGYSGMLRYKLDQFQQGKTQKNPVPTFKHTGGGGAGALQSGNAGALFGEEATSF